MYVSNCSGTMQTHMVDNVTDTIMNGMNLPVPISVPVAASTSDPAVEVIPETDDDDDGEQNDVVWKKPQAAQDETQAFEVSINSRKIVGFLDNISTHLLHIKENNSHARVHMKIVEWPGVFKELAKQQLFADIRAFAARVTKHEYWDNKNIPTGYQIMPQLSQRVHVVWFVPRRKTRHLRSFLKIDLIVRSNSMSGILHLSPVTVNRQILCRDQRYRVIQLENVTALETLLTELHQSDYMFLKMDCPDKAPVDIFILKFKLPHPEPKRNLNGMVQTQTNSITKITKTVDKFLQNPAITGKYVHGIDPERTSKYDYSFYSKSKKTIYLTIDIGNDVPHIEIVLNCIK
jgi:hypothetical protein